MGVHKEADKKAQLSTDTIKLEATKSKVTEEESKVEGEKATQKIVAKKMKEATSMEVPKGTDIVEANMIVEQKNSAVKDEQSAMLRAIEKEKQGVEKLHETEENVVELNTHVSKDKLEVSAA